MIYSKVRKVDGRYVVLNPDKITHSVMKALAAVGRNGINPEKVMEDSLEMLPEEVKHHIPTTDEIGDAVEKSLMHNGCEEAAKAFILFRDERARVREGRSSLINAVKDIAQEAKKDNANTPPSFPSKLLQIAEASIKTYTLNKVIPDDIAKLHLNGAIHIHDLFGYGLAWNCISIPLKKLLLEGFETGNGRIRPPRRPNSILALAAIVMQANQNEMVGGQMFAHFDFDIADILEENCKVAPTEGEVFQAIEGFIYNLNSMQSRYGGQRVFSNILIGTDISKYGRMVTKSILQVMQDGMDGMTFIWPNVIFRVKEGVNYEPGTPNHDLFLMACETSALRMNPTFMFMDSSYNASCGEEASYMGCRTRVISNVNGPEVIDGRGNISFTTINLPRIVFEVGDDLDKFYTLLDSRMESVREQLVHRLELTGQLKKSDFPFLLGQNIFIGSEGLVEKDTIYNVLTQGTQTVGFCGLEETVKLLTGSFMYESSEAHKLGCKIIKHMRKTTDAWTKEYKLNFSLLATPAESTAGRFCKTDAMRFGEVEGITDKDFYTNSNHICVDSGVPLYTKVELESPFHKLCNGGHICHVFLESSPQGNIEAIKTLVDMAKENDIGYFAISFPINECKDCRFSDPVTNDSCPKCGSENINRLRRITGYIAPLSNWGEGKLAELNRRVDK